MVTSAKRKPVQMLLPYPMLHFKRVPTKNLRRDALVSRYKSVNQSMKRTGVLCGHSVQSEQIRLS